MGFLSSLAEYDHDIVEHGHKYMKDEIYIKKTGWEGVKGILLHDKLGHPSPQLSLVRIKLGTIFLYLTYIITYQTTSYPEGP